MTFIFQFSRLYPLIVVTTEKGIEVEGNVGTEQQIGVVNSGTDLKGQYDKSSKDSTDYTLPYHVVIANASGSDAFYSIKIYDTTGKAISDRHRRKLIPKLHDKLKQGEIDQKEFERIGKLMNTDIVKNENISTK